MRLLGAIKSDITFQFKQGFYIIYLVISLAYIVALSWVPNEAVLKLVLPLIVFSDPSILGLFFIGGIIMLEKLQGVISCVVVTPLRMSEYIFAKVISLAMISVLAGVMITITTYHGPVQWLLMVTALILTSVFFTLCGFYVCAKCSTINQYLMKTIPIMMLMTLPCFSLIGFKYSELFIIFPSVAALKLLLGAFYGMNIFEALFISIYLVIVNYFALKYVKTIFEKYVVYGE